MNTNRLTNKTSKEKNRPKSPDKVKLVTAKKSNETIEEDVDELTSSTQFITPVDKYKPLKIDREKLISKHVPQPPLDKPKTSIRVRKPILPGSSKNNRSKLKVMVAHPLSPEVPYEIDQVLPPSSVPNLTEQDTLKDYHILGTLEEFCEEALKTGFSMNFTSVDDSSVQDDNLPKSSSSNTSTEYNIKINETNALKNWKKQMAERRRQQDYLSKYMLVSKDMLIMNQSDAFRSVQEERLLVDRAIPTKDYGKGYRVGSEFWKQVEAVGCEDGISITLNKTEKGLAPPIEHVGHPAHVKEEMGQNWGYTTRMKNVHYPWFKSSYLKERKEHLQDVINEIDPHLPYIDGLEVVGKSIKICVDPGVDHDERNDINGLQDEKKEEEEDDEQEDSYDPLSAYPDVIQQPIFGPSLIINGQTASWEGSEIPENNVTGLSVRLFFETETGSNTSSSIKLTNDGTTAIHYHWKKIPKKNLFNMAPVQRIKRFYFDVDDGTILPGGTVNIAIFFKSPNTGIFMETWQLDTKPVLLGGAAIKMILKGIATKEDPYESQRQLLKVKLQSSQNDRMVRRIINDLLVGINTPPRPSTPEGFYSTEEELFVNKNDKMVYKNRIINELKCFYEDIQPSRQWDLCVNTILKDALTIQSEEEKESALQKLNAYVQDLHNPVQTPVFEQRYNICYQLICESIDKISCQAIKLQLDYSIPERPLIIKPEPSPKNKKKLHSEKQPRTESRMTKKESPVGRNKSPIKEKSKTETTTNAPPDEFNETKTDAVDRNDPNYLKYLEKMHIQAYSCLSEMMESIELVLSSS